MKKLCLAFMAVFFVANLNAQSLKFGMKAGFNVASVNGIDQAVMPRIGFHFGFLAEIELTNSFSIQPEFLYSPQGVKDGSGIATLKLDYLSIPVLIKYDIIENFNFEIGPQFSFLINDMIVFDNNNNIDEETSIEHFDFGLIIGLAVKQESGVFFQGRYNVGITVIEENPDLRNGVFQLSVGYLF